MIFGRFYVISERYHHHAASSVFLSQHMAGPAGIFCEHFRPNIKKVPKKGEHAAMQDSARQDTLFSLVIRTVSDFVCHAVMSYYDLS
jgi:hypothetical protein